MSDQDENNVEEPQENVDADNENTVLPEEADINTNDDEGTDTIIEDLDALLPQLSTDERTISTDESSKVTEDDSLQEMLNKIKKFDDEYKESATDTYSSLSTLSPNDTGKQQADLAEEDIKVELEKLNWDGQSGSVEEGVNLWRYLVGTINLYENTKVQSHVYWKILPKLPLPSRKQKDLVFGLWSGAKENRKKFKIGKMYPADLRRIPNDLTNLEHFKADIMDIGLNAALTFKDLTGPKKLLPGYETHFQTACEKLTEKHCSVAIAEHCCMVHYQEPCQTRSPIPTILTPMVLAPVLLQGMNAEYAEEILCIVTNENRISKYWEESLSGCNVRVTNRERCILWGLDSVKYKGFKETEVQPEEKFLEMQTKLKTVLTKAAKKMYGVRAIISLSPDLPKFSQCIKEILESPVYDTLSVMDSVTNAYNGYSTQRVRKMRFFRGLKRIKVLRRQDTFADSIGILEIACNKAPQSFLRVQSQYGIEFRLLSLPGLSYKHMTGKKLKKDVNDLAINLINDLQEKHGVAMIMGANSLFHTYGENLKTDVNTIFFPSICSLLPMLMSMYHPDAKILVLTSELGMVRSKWRDILRCLLLKRAHVDRLVLDGVKRWDDALNGMVPSDMEIKILHIVAKAMKKHKIQAVLMESYNLTQFSNSIRNLFNICVYDAMFLVDLISSGFSESKLIESLDQKDVIAAAEPVEEIVPRVDFEVYHRTHHHDKPFIGKSTESNVPYEKSKRNVKEVLLRQVKEEFSRIEKLSISSVSKSVDPELQEFSLFKFGQTEIPAEIVARKRREWKTNTNKKIKLGQHHISRYSEFLEHINNVKYEINLQPEWEESEFDRYYGIETGSYSNSVGHKHTKEGSDDDDDYSSYDDDEEDYSESSS